MRRFGGGGGRGVGGWGGWGCGAATTSWCPTYWRRRTTWWRATGSRSRTIWRSCRRRWASSPRRGPAAAAAAAVVAAQHPPLPPPKRTAGRALALARAVALRLCFRASSLRAPVSSRHPGRVALGAFCRWPWKAARGACGASRGWLWPRAAIGAGASPRGRRRGGPAAFLWSVGSGYAR